MIIPPRPHVAIYKYIIIIIRIFFYKKIYYPEGAGGAVGGSRPFKSVDNNTTLAMVSSSFMCITNISNTTYEIRRWCISHMTGIGLLSLVPGRKGFHAWNDPAGPPPQDHH